MNLSASTDGNDSGREVATPAAASWPEVIAGIRDDDRTPLVLLLLKVIEEYSQRIADLETELTQLTGEITQLKGGPKKPASNSKPSKLSKPFTPPLPDGKRPGSQKRSKTHDLPIHAEVPVTPKPLPPDAKLLRRDAFVVQDLVIKTHNTRYWLETWQAPTGSGFVANCRREFAGISVPDCLVSCCNSITRPTFPRVAFSKNCGITASTFPRAKSTTC
ncbi:hypothetical protein [Fimbriiglobus ruber]|uniref:hypothetical protein n=1 Tax=Fimbriiglobus ruber TaxID=1908690 RepID=UPI00137A4D70|nr:hypothetical protein [Fimbriiglobus ruber]